MIVTTERRLRKIHNQELHDLWSSPNIIIVTESRRIRWAGHTACVAEV